MKKILYGLSLVVLVNACSPKTGELISEMEKPASMTPIEVSLNLAEISNDRVWVEINPGLFTEDTVIYRLPRVVQGTYDVSDFGSFTEDFVAYNYMGDSIEVERLDVNSWAIPNTQMLATLGYYVNDTFDIEGTETPTPFSPSGTNIEPDNFVLNLHGFIGYFDQLDDSEYLIEVSALATQEKISALPLTSTAFNEDSTIVIDTYFADRYFEVTDNPMMYGELDIERFQVGDIEIVLSVYSPNFVHTAASIKETVFKMMEAQKAYLGDMNTTKRYDIFLYMPTAAEGQASGFGALEHHTSTVVVLPEWMNADQLGSSMIDVVSHEFFHILTPLSVHSEDVHYFDYNAPTFSKHLWMYEGVTEYFASHFQAYEDLQPREAFYEKIQSKISTSLTLNDAMSFTKMSENILEEPYASEYYNVYMKGALIGMCIDILMREESNGERSMLSLMKELSGKYGVDKPFEDDAIIAEITAMSYPSVGEFLTTHVIGDTPIDYEVFFDKVGLAFKDINQTTTLFFNGQVPFIDANPESGEIFFLQTPLNSTLVEWGIQAGDVIKSINGAEYDLSNISRIIPSTFNWTSETEVSMVVIRDGEEVEVSGLVGTPNVIVKKISELENATEAQVALRNFWLEK